MQVTETVIPREALANYQGAKSIEYQLHMQLDSERFRGLVRRWQIHQRPHDFETILAIEWAYMHPSAYNNMSVMVIEIGRYKIALKTPLYAAPSGYETRPAVSPKEVPQTRSLKLLLI